MHKLERRENPIRPRFTPKLQVTPIRKIRQMKEQIHAIYSRFIIAIAYLIVGCLACIMIYNAFDARHVADFIQHAKDTILIGGGLLIAWCVLGYGLEWVIFGKINKAADYAQSSKEPGSRESKGPGSI